MLFSSHHIKGTYKQHDITIDVNFDHLPEVVFVRFLHWELILLIAAPPHCALRTGVSVCSPHPRSGEPCPPLLECGVYIHFFFFFYFFRLGEECVFSPTDRFIRSSSALISTGPWVFLLHLGTVPQHCCLTLSPQSS